MASEWNCSDTIKQPLSFNSISFLSHFLSHKRMKKEDDGYPGRWSKQNKSAVRPTRMVHSPLHKEACFWSSSIIRMNHKNFKEIQGIHLLMAVIHLLMAVIWFHLLMEHLIWHCSSELTSNLVRI